MDTNTEYNEFLSAQNVRFIKSQFTLHITMHQPMLADQYRLKLKSIVHSLVSISNTISIDYSLKTVLWITQTCSP